jgi:TetR/AcrR family transcriptional regulator, fatty acid metabolism regulator protein
VPPEQPVVAEPEEAVTDKQERIIRAAYDVMAEHGVDRVSLQDVADEAGVSKGLILYHFETKANLVLKTMRWVLTRVEQRIRDSVAGTDDPVTKMTAMIDAIFVSPDANRQFYLIYIELLDHAARFEPFSDLSKDSHEIVNGLYAQLVRDGVEAGTFRDYPIDEAATVLRAIIDGLFLQWLQEADHARAHRRYRDMCVRSALAYLGADGDRLS